MNYAELKVFNARNIAKNFNMNRSILYEIILYQIFLLMEKYKKNCEDIFLQYFRNSKNNCTYKQTIHFYNDSRNQ